MRLFGRRKREPVTNPVHDPALGDPTATKLLTDVKLRDWRAVHDLLNGIDDPDDLQFHLNLCAERNGVQAWVEDWIDEEPRSYLPFLVAGTHAITWAWQARGYARAKNTLPAQFRMFHRRLHKAQALLAESVARNPDDPCAWAGLVTCSRGLELGLDETRSRFREAVARHRWHLGAHQNLLMRLLKKWGGSHDMALDFAEETTASAPPTSGLATLVVTAHHEHWRVDLDYGDDKEYLNSPETIASLHAAAERSVLHPSYQRRLGWQHDFNKFAMLFWQTDQWDAAAAMFDAVGDHVTQYPWDFLAGDFTETFQAARDEVNEHRTTKPG